MKKSPLVVILCGVVGLVMFACSSSGSATAATPAESNTANCTDTCAALERLCAAPAPGCASACSGLSNAARSCIVSASSCSAAQRCELLQDPVASLDSGTTTKNDSGSEQGTSYGTNRPGGKCSTNLGKTCKPGMYCVDRSSVASETGCVAKPQTCNGSTTDLCPCLYPMGTPCQKGATNCSVIGGNLSVACK